MFTRFFYLNLHSILNNKEKKMKKFRFFVLTAALVSAFAFSSCLDSDGDSVYPSYQCAVTVGPGAFTLYADNGSVLRPMTTVTGLDKLERAVVAFDLVSESLNGSELEPGKSYDVKIDPYYSYSIATSTVIDLYENEAAVDSLVNTQDAINQIAGFYGAKGYITASISVNFNQGVTPYMNVAYNSKEDIDVQNAKVNLTLYYDDKSNYGNYSSTSLFSFKLPGDIFRRVNEEVSADSVTVALNYRSSSMGEGQKVECKMAKKDLFFTAY